METDRARTIVLRVIDMMRALREEHRALSSTQETNEDQRSADAAIKKQYEVPSLAEALAQAERERKV